MIIAVDPGASGGIVIMQESGIVTSCKMPSTDGDILACINNAILGMFKCAKIGERKVAYIEKVGGFAGGEGQPGSAMFNFGDGYGYIRGVLSAKGFRLMRPTPQAWQKVLSLGTREHARCPAGSSPLVKKEYSRKNAMFKTAWKNKLKARAQELYPDQKVTLATADALLILQYAKISETLISGGV